MGEEEVTEAELVGVPQNLLGLRVDQEQRRSLLDGVGVGEEEVEVMARLQSLTLPHAGNWLNVAPILSLGLHLRPREFVMAAKYRLGLPLYREMEGEGHNSLRDAVHDLAAEAGMGPSRGQKTQEA